MICVDIEAPELETTSKKVIGFGGSAFYFQCDITNKNQVERTINRIEKEIGDITMLFHCCSLPSARSLVHSPSSDKQTIEVSVTSYFYVSFCFKVVCDFKVIGLIGIICLFSYQSLNGIFN